MTKNLPSPVLPGPSDHWPRYAQHWSKVASPLSPHADDLRIYVQELDAQARTLLLGVTPQIAGLNLRGVAVDLSLDMIRANPPASERWAVLQANWLALPLEAGSVCQVVSDGALTMLRHTENYKELLQELRRVLQPGGKCVLRLFVAPDMAESVDNIQHDLVTGNIGSFHALKWRLMMSLSTPQNNYNVRVADVLALFNSHFANRATFLHQTGWPVEVYQTIDVYQNSNVSLSFVPRAALDALFNQFASQVRYRTGSYELAERCPIVILEDFYP